MYGICGQRSDGKALNCPNHTRSVKVTLENQSDLPFIVWPQNIPIQLLSQVYG